MAIDKAVDSSQLDSIFTGIADAIRRKNGLTFQYAETELEGAIDDLPAGTEILTAEGTVRPSSGSANVSFSFVPDVMTVWLQGGDEYESGSLGKRFVCCVTADFSLSDNILCNLNLADGSDLVAVYFMRDQTFVDLMMRRISSGAYLSGYTFSYKAYKFTQ